MDFAHGLPHLVLVRILDSNDLVRSRDLALTYLVRVLDVVLEHYRV